MFPSVNLIFAPPVRAAEAETSHLARQRSVSVAAVMSVKSSWVVVLSVPGPVPGSVPVSIAVAVVGSGVSIIQVCGLGGLRGLGCMRVLGRLRGLGFRGVRSFTAVTTISAGDGAEILKRKKEENMFKKLKEAKENITSTVNSMEVLQKQTNMNAMVKERERVTSKDELLMLGGTKKG